MKNKIYKKETFLETAQLKNGASNYYYISLFVTVRTVFGKKFVSVKYIAPFFRHPVLDMDYRVNDMIKFEAESQAARLKYAYSK